MSRTSRRPAIWAAVRKLARDGLDITTTHVRGLLPGAVPLGLIGDYLRDLAAAGILGRDPDLSGVYALVSDPGAEAPRVRRDGSRVTQGAGREALWRTMGVLGTFGVAELALSASTEAHRVAPGEARDYVFRLAHAGFLARIPGQPPRFRVLPSRRCGPLPPQIRRDKHILDPNTGALYRPDGTVLIPGGAR